FWYVERERDKPREIVLSFTEDDPLETRANGALSWARRQGDYGYLAEAEGDALTRSARPQRSTAAPRRPPAGRWRRRSRARRSHRDGCECHPRAATVLL